MASVFGNGPISWRMERDAEGFRTYHVMYRVQAEITESPAAVMRASGLPALGSNFDIAGYTGSDVWCWCRPEMSVTIDQEKKGDPAQFYLVEKIFSNKYDLIRCGDTDIENPLLEPMKISGSFTKLPWEAKYDRNGSRLVTSSNEPITGSEVTFNYTRPTVHIEQNVANLGLSTFSNQVNTVNESPLWGVPARCVLLSNTSWERKTYGRCSFFYTRSFDFEIDFYNRDREGNIIGFDKEILDSGSMCLRGQWIVDATSEFYGCYRLLSNVMYTEPSSILNSSQGDFMAYKDLNNENTRVILDGHGRPANTKIVYTSGAAVSVLTGTGFNNAPYTTSQGFTGPPASARLEYSGESDFLLLGIPTSF